MSADTEPVAPPMADDLPGEARKRLTEMRARKLFTSDLSVGEFLLVKEAGFEPLGLVMGTSIYQVIPDIPRLGPGEPGRELTAMTQALHDARELAMTRMEEEADALGADGIVGVRLEVNLATDPRRLRWQQYRAWSRWAQKVGFRRPPQVPATGWFQQWEQLADAQWKRWCTQQGWTQVPQTPWLQAGGKTAYAFGANTAEFIAVGTAVRHVPVSGSPEAPINYKNRHGRPFQSDLSGQDFWMLIRSGYRPVGFVMGNCVYYVPPRLLQVNRSESRELPEYTHALYDAREIAIERLQDEAEELGATGVVGVTIVERQHPRQLDPANAGNAALTSGELIELFVVGTAVVPTAPGADAGPTELVISARNDAPPAGAGGEE